MPRYNFKNNNSTYSLDMTASTVARFFENGDLEYEEADYYGYYAVTSLTPSGSLDTGYFIKGDNDTTYPIKAVPNRGFKSTLTHVDKIEYYTDSNCTNLIGTITTATETKFYGGSLYQSGETQKGISAHRLTIYVKKYASTGYHFTNDQTVTTQVTPYNLIAGGFSEDTSDSNCKYWTNVTATATVNTYTVTFTAGTGVTDIKAGSSINGPGYTSGHAFDYGSTIYLFIKVQSGYNVPSGFYYVSSGSMYGYYYKTYGPLTSNYSFGTINCTIAITAKLYISGNASKNRDNYQCNSCVWVGGLFLSARPTSSVSITYTFSSWDPFSTQTGWHTWSQTLTYSASDFSNDYEVSGYYGIVGYSTAQISNPLPPTYSTAYSNMTEAQKARLVIHMGANSMLNLANSVRLSVTVVVDGVTLTFDAPSMNGSYVNNHLMVYINDDSSDTSSYLYKIQQGSGVIITTGYNPIVDLS